jgi:hypothetical protein
MERTIELCEITELRFKNEVDVMYNDGSVERLFYYYPDEITFTEREFIGLTREEAMSLHTSRDKAYLRR